MPSSLVIGSVPVARALGSHVLPDSQVATHEQFGSACRSCGQSAPGAAGAGSGSALPALAAAAPWRVQLSLLSPTLQSSPLQTLGGKQRRWGKSCGGGERLSNR